MPAIYDQHGLRFLYPENWQLSDEQPGGLQRVVSVQSPDGGFWSMHVHSAAAPVQQLADEALRAMRQEYENLEFEHKTEQIGQFEAVGFDMEFYCLDLVVTARVRGLNFDGKALLLLYQAEDREFEKLEPVFRAITLSLIQPSEQAL